jgi:hypothetical protein
MISSGGSDEAMVGGAVWRIWKTLYVLKIFKYILS